MGGKGKDLETIGEAARRLLAKMDARNAKGKDGSERREGSEELKKPERSADDAQHPGSYRAGGVRGLEIGGGPLDLGCNSFSFEASEDANGPDAGSIPSTDRGERERSLPYVFSELNARAPRRARLDGTVGPLPVLSSRLQANDNVRHAALDCSISSRVARRDSVSIAQYTMP